ncbi:putative CoA transferase, subunit A [Dethiobacter alkaliphilus AHT 1]|uniref:Putative CoA transferase, subunit A n=1 Tax=Dethiobacter alkaliphilus AHT 1 TaxID=555088 RepID=C0GDT4_DETAL|nr:putative CoA transferase, subunit A [Dethiobacter alkaliphilus AHT 1]
MGIPFMPVRGVIGTDYTSVRPDFKIVKNPYGDDEVLVVPAISPDVSLIHAFKADGFGNCIVNSSIDDALLARASQKVIISAEEIVDTEELKSSQRGNFVSRVHVDAVVRLPQGAFPTACGSYYRADIEALKAYQGAAKDPEGFARYIETFCRRFSDGGEAK